ncbi:peptidase S8/S53 domain-containing protein [Desarmillaria tabescens]|uniref:tripeptidyl-peptidase II n=1 Tax=Armillaria tabescens TaxID=1929756 RepID=A0AA39NA45_ARMTA|nr:peptidase S8/S53 domain-containing protein [Desarmillaria tabescens]KAK0461798.1 peptidase S8/S53 domain-containing protein [Desarmillaria tabescens]
MRLLPFVAFFVPFAFASSDTKRWVPREKETFNAPNGWTKHSLPSPDHMIELQIGLRQPSFHVLEQHLWEVSDPDHPRYGQHLSKEEVDALVAPDAESLELVHEWLASYGVDEVSESSARDWVRVTLPVQLVEEMLDTTYHVWQHTDGDYLVRTTRYSLPEVLLDHIDVVQPTTLFGRWKGMKSTVIDFENFDLGNTADVAKLDAETDDVDPACNVSITVSCLKQLYNAVGYVPSDCNKDSSIGVTAYLEQYANEADLQLFYHDQVPEAVGSTFDFISVKGGLNDQNISLAGVEANLDVQFAFGLAFPIPRTFYSTAGRPPFIPDETSTENTNEPYNDWLDFVLSRPDPPRVISTSYGEAEQTVPESYARRTCQGFAQLGARGVTLTFSSGDGGVGDGNPDPATQQCITNDGQNRTQFMPLFPAGCPFVTAIGGTVNVPEIAVDFSGGGFSNYFSRPSYQDAVIDAYLNMLPEGTYEGLFNRSGRAFPDIAAQGRRFRVWFQNTTISVGGTSASSPTAAAIFALLNDARLAKGLPTLGFVNPLLYKDEISATFNDITEGNNPGCGTPGFNATKGWDPITGFGTPNFGWLKELLAP